MIEHQILHNGHGCVLMDAVTLIFYQPAAEEPIQKWGLFKFSRHSYLYGENYNPME